MVEFVYEIHDNLSPELCQQIIQRFENDPRAGPGQTGGGYKPDMKSSIDLCISRFQEWEDICAILTEKLRENTKKYQYYLDDHLPYKLGIHDSQPTGFQIQKSGFYRWHNDARVEYGRERVLTFIWYLNTVEEGGHTGFLHKSVKPELGKFVFFPATWDYVHCGFEAKDKYIITGWTWRAVVQ